MAYASVGVIVPNNNSTIQWRNLSLSFMVLLKRLAALYSLVSKCRQRLRFHAVDLTHLVLCLPGLTGLVADVLCKSQAKNIYI